MQNSFKYIESIIQVIPFIQKYSGKVIVIKYGGSVMQNEKLKRSVIEDIILLYSVGIKLILVHGGGPIINQWLVKCNIEPKFHNGIRITDYETMEIVEMVLVGKVNKELVGLLNKNYNCAVGLSGKDANLFSASSLLNLQNDFAGKIDLINREFLNLLLNSNYIPVIASVASSNYGKTYNINADTVAGAIAKSLRAEKLILLTDAPGIMHDLNDIRTLEKSLNISQVSQLKQKKIISGGMIPKVDCCIDALRSDVKSAHIIDGRLNHSLLLEVLTSQRVGSMLTL
uniref:Acetylglutamate kinase n=1 Tax=Caulacanthus okamurae TaxID=152008 RepID=A0A6H1U8A1_9FLOR|nr:acetylglutamate kinase [Caulacanthus okamurae]QIZ74627.1 acetylglutamate kinase [Caulacanthus okamurae]